MTGNLREPRPDDAVLGSTSGFITSGASLCGVGFD